jgi:hypothetical protein
MTIDYINPLLRFFPFIAFVWLTVEWNQVKREWNGI